MKIFILLFVLLTAFLMNAMPGYGQEDLKISLSASHVAANPGEEITYIINYSNAGLTAASNIIITDQLPASGLYTYVSSIPEGTISGNVITWNSTQIPDLTLLGAGQRQIYVTVKAGVVGNGITQASNGYYIPSESIILDNYATIKSMSTETLIQSDNVSTTVSQNCNVHINNASGMIKSATNTTVYYLMQITNNGNVYDRYDLSSLNYDCDGPATKNFDLLEAAFTDLGGNPITKTEWIGPNQTYFFHLQLKAGGGTNPGNLSCHDVIAKSLVSGYEGTGKIQTIIEGSLHIPLVSLSKIDTRDPVQAGEEFTYTIYAFNSNGAYPADDFVINETYPDNITFIRSDPAPDIGYNNKWSLGTLGYGLNSAKTISITVQVNSSENCKGEIFNEVYASYVDYNSLNPPKASVTTTVESYPDLSITKTAVASSTPAKIGESITYTLHYQNKGTCIAPNVRIKDLFDDLHTNITDAGGGSQSENEITWDLGSLAPGQPGSKTYTVLIDPDAPFDPGTTSIPNTASISTTENESSYNNNLVSANVLVFVLPDLKVEISSVNPTFELGTENTYRLKVSNVGDIDAADVVIKDLLPTGLTVGTISHEGINIGGIVTWPAIPTLEAGNSIEFTVTVTPSCVNFPSITNSANVTSSIIDKNEDNNTATLTSSVKDLVKPILTDVPADETVSCDAIPAVGTPTATDNCDPVPVVHYLGETSNKGTDPLLPSYYNYSIIRKWEAVDASENHSDQMEQVITIQDITPPIAPLLTDVTGECALSLEPPVALDNCQNPVTGTTTTEFPITAQGTTVVAWSFDDGNGNVTTAYQNVILQDKTPPEMPVLADVTVGQCSGTPEAPTTTDNCLETITGTTTTEFPITAQGATVVAWSFDDGHGNVTTANQNVIVYDTTPPEIPVLADVIVGECSGTPEAPTTTDNCLETITGTTTTEFPITAQGATVVVWSFDDGHGNVTTANQNVIVYDTTPPEIPVLADVIVGECSGTPEAPTTIDNCLETITGTTTTEFPITTKGITEVEWSFDDGHGNTITAKQNVIVDDTTDPVADVETLPTVTGECSVTASAPTATDNCEGPIVGTTEDPTTYSLQGTYTIHWIYDDGNGNTSSQSQTVVVNDITAPVADVETLPTVTGECSATVSAPTATDNCEGTVTGTTEDAFTYTVQGTYTIDWTFDDGNSNTSTQTQTVIVDDVTAPVADLAVLPDLTGQYMVIAPVPTATDNCSGIITGTTPDPLTYSEQGTYTIHWTYDDGNGNTSTQMQTVVVDDTTTPETPVLTDVTVGECNGTPVAPTTTDNSSGVITGTTTTEFPITAQGITVVTWTFDDGNGNVTTAYQNVIVDDISAPVYDVQTLATVTGECSVTVSAPTATDNCEGTITGTTTDPLSYSVQGTYTIHWTYDDGNGNTSSQTQTVVVDDITPPEMPVLADVIVGECSGTPPTPSTVDNCAGIVMGQTSIIFPKTKQGKSTIIWTFDDGNGNVTSAYQNLIVDDITAPVADQETLPTVTGECSVSVSAPTATDNCKGTIWGTTEDPTTYSIQGTYTIHWIYDDGNGNTSTQMQTVVVDDITPPEMPVLADVIVGQCSGTPEAPTTTDNCLGTVTGTTATKFPITAQGTTVVTWSFDDGSGNVITANQHVLVIDNTPPVITGSIVASTVEGCDITHVTPPVTTVSELEALGITVSDACTADIELRVTSNDIHTGISPVVVTRTYTITDPYDNSTTYSQSIMVVDSESPTITIASPLASYPSNNGLCTYKVTGTQLDPLATADNCSVKSVTNNFNNSSSLKDAMFPTGITKVIWTVEDAGGNKTSASYDIVVADTQNPEIACAMPSVSYPSDAGVCSYKVLGTDLDPKVTTDNCSVKSITNDFNKASSLKDAVFPIGTTKVTWTVEDVNGNKTTCMVDIVVVDTQNPVIQCVESTADYAYQTPGTELDPIATDNCGVASIVNDFTNSASLQGAKFEPGTTVIKWTATDHSGNKSICSITIEVADILPPTITCAPVAATGYEADQGVCTYKVLGTAFDPAIEDNYSEVDIVNNYNHRASLNEAQFPVGETTVIWTATDKSGNSSTCTQIIKVNDTQKPTITAPANLSVKADAGKCTASALALGTPVTADNCSVASVTNDAPEIFPLGQTVVTWKVTDKSGNIVTSAQTVVVERLLIAVDDAVSLKEDNQGSGNVLANDAGLCNVPIQVKSHSEPAHGELTMADNGDFTYIPDENYHGTDKFTYQICSSPGECSEATVTITVESVNDLPIATEDKQTIQLDLVLQGDVADNDRMSGDGVNVWTMVDQPAHGTILFHPDGTYTYSPNADFLGSDSFTYKLCDADGDCSQAKVSIRIEDVLLPNQILTPNGDDVNDTFIIVGIDLYPQNKLTMYNRWGNVVYQKNNYQNEWDGNSNVGKIGSKSLPVGTYYYLIDYGKGRHKTGFVYLDR